MINPVEVELLLNNYPRVIVTDYLDGFGAYLLAEIKGDFINLPQRVVISKLAYRYVKWRVAWDEQLTHYTLHKRQHDARYKHDTKKNGRSS